MINVNRNCPTVVTGSAASELVASTSRVLPELNKRRKRGNYVRACLATPFYDSTSQGVSFMSHIVSIQTEVRDPVAVRSACERLSLPQPTHGTFKLFTSTATGLGVQLPEWRYPVVCDTTNGQLAYDNFGGRWGEQRQLDRFLQGTRSRSAGWKRGGRVITVTEQSLADGSIKLTIQVGGAA